MSCLFSFLKVEVALRPDPTPAYEGCGISIVTRLFTSEGMEDYQPVFRSYTWSITFLLSVKKMDNAFETVKSYE